MLVRLSDNEQFQPINSSAAANVIRRQLLDVPMRIGGYSSAQTPDEPVVLHMVRNPNSPGLPRKEQNRIGRADMLNTDYATIEREIRSQLQRMLGGAGFDAARDIAGITVNRWPPGHSHTCPF